MSQKKTFWTKKTEYRGLSLPRYTYRCKACDCVFEVVHAMGEVLSHCTACEAQDSLSRIPPQINIKGKKKPSKEKKPGKRVKTFIEDARKELNLEKKKLKTDYKNDI